VFLPIRVRAATTYQASSRQPGSMASAAEALSVLTTDA
jgi:hypothetical protein